MYKNSQKNPELSGKIPPQAIDIEEAVLGSILIDPYAFDKVSDKLTAETFYKDGHIRIWKALEALRAKNSPIDTLTLTMQLKSSSELEIVGGGYFITMLTSRVVSSYNIEFHASILKEKHIMRQIIRIGSDISRRAYDETEDCFELLAETQGYLTSLTGFNKGSVKHISRVLADIMKGIDYNMLNEKSITGIPTGFTFFDEFSRGLQKSDLIIIAAETSNGKTALALNITTHAASLNYKIAMYSYEMSDRQLVTRVLATTSEVNSKRIMYSKLSTDELNSVNAGIGSLAETNVWVDDLCSNSYSYLERSIRAMKIKEDIDLAVIDYLQLIQMTGVKGLSTADKTAMIANNLKGLAKNLDIPILLISQLSRDKQNPKPTLGRLKGSGDIENAADVIWLPWHPVMHGQSTFECRGITYPSYNNSQHFIAKGRNIGVTEFALGWEKEYTRFTNEIYDSVPVF